MIGRRPRADFTENLEAVAHGVRRLEQIQDPILREAVAAALRLRERDSRLDTASRVRMRNTVLAALAPAKPTLGDRVYGAFALIGKPAPMLVRGLATIVVIAAMLGGAAVSSADSLPDDALYSFKLAGEQVRLAVAVDPGDRASVELSIAEHRLDEAERLATNGREDDAIIATASYGSSLADAAADLASVESTDPRAAALVTQMQTSLTTSRVRVAATATKLAANPRTAGTAEVLAVLAATAAPSTVSPATKIADQAAAITARLSVVADDRVKLSDPKRTETPRASLTPRTDPTAAVAAPSTGARGGTSASPSPRGSGAAARAAAGAAPVRTETPTSARTQTAPTNAGAA
ncbi:MAG: DUF5667 domain-containing protein, partial [Chloroflexota bacterium]|nr:DUF5667 domain-containing protein [Chloroflexota bacterium]